MGYRNYAEANGFIVDSSGLGDFKTIQAAITAAAAAIANSDNVSLTVFVKSGLTGVYTENLTLQPSVNITAWPTDQSNGAVVIKGKASFSAAGSVSIAGIQLLTNSDNCIALSGSNGSTIYLQDCFINCQNTAISMSGTTGISISNCQSNFSTTGVALFSSSSSGTITILSSNLTNTGSSTTASTLSAGTCFVQYSSGNIPFSTTSTGVLNFSNANFNTASAGNSSIITTAGSGTSTAYNCSFNSGSASVVSVGTGTTLNMSGCILIGSNTNIITGAGTCAYNGCIMPGSSSGVNVTTQTGTGPIQGLKNTSTVNTPTAGFIGEQIRATTNSVSTANTTSTNLTTISVTAGVWDISGVASFSSSGATNTSTRVCVNTVSSTLGTDADNVCYGSNATSGVTNGGASVPSWRFTTTSTTTVYLIAFVTFSGGSMTANGRISATRVG